MRLTKKEIKLYQTYGKKWEVEVKYYITLCKYDIDNICRVHEKLIDLGLIPLKRITRRIKFFNKYIYINIIYGGKND